MVSRIRERRESLGLTIKDVAEKVDVHFTTVSEWELEKIRPRPAKRIELAKALETSVDHLFPPETFQKATHKGDLKIGKMTIKCAVLEDGSRVLTRATFVKAIGRRGKAKGGSSYDDDYKTPVFLTAKNLKPYIPEDLENAAAPVIFKLNGQESIGYRAELLPKVCGVFLDAEEAGDIAPNQKHIVERCKLLIRGLATVGIIALVDEATGYQEVRDRQALQKILEAYIAKELQPWIKTFPDEYYKEIFRLREWEYKPLATGRPGVVGRYTNNLIYERLAPGVLEELRKQNPTTPTGRRKYKHFQTLTPETGHPKLKEHISNVVVLMKASVNWDGFMAIVDRALPKFTDGRQLRIESALRNPGRLIKVEQPELAD
jgi:transcriptional regulator with XRE-family HTH domain